MNKSFFLVIFFVSIGVFFLLKHAQIKTVDVERFDTYDNRSNLKDHKTKETSVVLSTRMETLEVADDLMIHGYSDSFPPSVCCRTHYPSGNNMKTVEMATLEYGFEPTDNSTNQVCLSYPVYLTVTGMKHYEAITTATNLRTRYKIGKWIF